MLYSLAIVLLTLASVSGAQTVCPSSQPEPVGLCCRVLVPFSSNSYVWSGICGITDVTPDTPTAAFCSPPACAGSEEPDWISVCCERLATCGNGVDGPIGINCTRISS